MGVSLQTVAIYLAEGVQLELAEAAGEALERELGLATKTGPPLALPPEAFDAARGQYRAELVLAALPAEPGAFLALGLVAVDLYTPGLNFIFGMAAGARALVSTARLGDGAAARSGRALFLRRLQTEVVHEVGHCLGLRHCRDPHCVMFFSNTLADTDRKGPALCDQCRAKLATASRRAV
ncbi:MAG: archaemetzincin family Zn-dependent metalloprotease [Armatimonadetes bacterium]|nr:archaemetzincin family Zn-dependent metalloprotease [Armatimonadota bacterium]